MKSKIINSKQEEPTNLKIKNHILLVDELRMITDFFSILIQIDGKNRKNNGSKNI